MNPNSRQRLDLTEWVIHFIHDRKPEDDPSTLADIPQLEGYVGDLRLPDYYDEYGNGKHILNEYEENEYSLEEDAPALDVLKKILHDGFIKSGWSIRNMSPTIYGPKSAVCFTEMPLYALIEYAKFRQLSGYVGNHGIAFRRNELFAAGARPVIYGLSTPHIEAGTNTQGVYQGRLLSPQTGIGIQEQYRYVATNLPKIYGPGQKATDWTHEREWRWALPYDSLGVPGLPFFLSKDYADFFTEVIIIVPTNDEMEEILTHLKTLYDAGGTNVGRAYNCQQIAAARVLSLESMAHLSGGNISSMRIDDLPTKQMKLMPNFPVTPALDKKVRDAVIEAGIRAQRAVKDYLTENPEFNDQMGDWGWTYVCTKQVSEITQALQNAGLSKTYSDGVYRLHVENHPTHSVMLSGIGTRAAAEYLTSELGQKFYVIREYD